MHIPTCPCIHPNIFNAFGIMQRIAGHDDVATQLRDTKWRLQQLETQYDHATSKANAQMEAFKMAEEQLEVGALIIHTDFNSPRRHLGSNSKSP